MYCNVERSLYNLRVNTLSQGVQSSKDEPRESESVPTLPVPASERKGPKLEPLGVGLEGLFSKNGAGEAVQKWNTKVQGRRDKGGPEVE